MAIQARVPSKVAHTGAGFQRHPASSGREPAVQPQNGPCTHLNPMLMSFLGLRERCQYWHSATGLGSSTPAVYTAWDRQGPGKQSSA